MRLREFATRINELALGAGLPAEPVASSSPDEAQWIVRTQANEYLVKFDFDPEPQEDEYVDYDDYEMAYNNSGMNTAFYARDKNGQWTMDITNVGEKELTQIIATVARLLAEFLKQHKHLTHIGISGKDRRRDQIYQRLIQQNLQRYFPGQEFAIDQGGIRRVIKEFAPTEPGGNDDGDVPPKIYTLANRWWNNTDDQDRIAMVLRSMGWDIQQADGEEDVCQLTYRDGSVYYLNDGEFDPDLFEVSDELLQRYLGRADRQVSNRLDRMSQARERLNKGWEIYDHDNPTRIIDRFEADSPREAQQYYQNFIDNYNPGDENFEFYLRRSTGIMEIARIPQRDLDGWGDKDTLEPMTTPPKNRKPLPGGSGFTYAVNRGDPEFLEIMIFDGDTLAAELDLFATLDPLKTWRVETVITDPDYRGQGLGKALYGIALSILKLTIEAGDQQTKFGQQMWLMLDSIPGVEVLGYAMESTDRYRPRPGDQVVDQNDVWTRFTFPVEPGRRSMRSTRSGTGIYSSQHVSMIAKWTGR
jgi:GNAT superfamily N-acetyltransferase